MQAVASDHAGGGSDEISAGRSHDVSEHQDAAGSAGSGKLAGLFHEYGHRGEIENLDPGSAWVAVSRYGLLVPGVATLALIEHLQTYTTHVDVYHRHTRRLPHASN